MFKNPLYALVAIAISSLFVSSCSTTGDKKNASYHTPSSTDSSIAEEITPDHNIGPGNTIRSSEGKIIDPLNGNVVEE